MSLKHCGHSRLFFLLFFLVSKAVRGQEDSSACMNATALRDILIREEGSQLETIRICPNTTLSLARNDTLEISNSVVVTCGESGTSDNNCTLHGGDIQVLIEGNETFAEFYGIRFLESYNTSVQVDATGNSSVYFGDCIWEGHVGETVVVVEGGEYNTTSIEIDPQENSTSDDEVLVEPVDPDVGAEGDENGTISVNGTSVNSTSVNGTSVNGTSVNGTEPTGMGNDAHNASMTNETEGLVGDDGHGIFSSDPHNTSLTNHTEGLIVGENGTGIFNESLTNDTVIVHVNSTSNSSLSGNVGNATDVEVVDGHGIFSNEPSIPQPEPIPSEPTLDPDLEPSIPEPEPIPSEPNGNPPPPLGEDVLDNPNEIDGDNPQRTAPKSGRKRRHSFPSRRRLKSSMNISVGIFNCEFLDNNVSKSVLWGAGVNLSIAESWFESNTANISVISVLSGDLALSRTDFSALDDTPAHVFVANEASIVSNEENCGMETDGCNGVYMEGSSSSASCPSSFGDCVGECDSFEMCTVGSPTEAPEANVTASPTESPSAAPTAPLQSVECPNNSTLVGYVDMESIQADLGNGVTSFDLCPGSSIDGSLELRISNDTLSIECMDKSCVWVANTFHVRLQGENYGVRARGITFREAVEDSITLRYDTDSDPDFVFKDCVWEQNSGTGVFILNGNAAVSERFLSTDVIVVAAGGHRRHERSLQQSQNDFIRCDFRNNVVEEVVYLENALLNVANCSFSSNVAQGSMIAAFSSSLNLTSTKFRNNRFDAGQGLVHAGQTSSFDSDDICGRNNIPNVSGNDQCEGLLLGGGDCTQLPECELECIGTWTKLVAVLEGGQRELVVCGNSTIEIPDESPILLSNNDTVLQCGSEGLKSDQCILSGGTDQVVVAASGVNISGIIFMGSSRTSVRAEGVNHTVATLEDCEFVGHSGVTVVLSVTDGEDLVEAIIQGDLKLSDVNSLRPEKPSMSIALRECLFSDNRVTLAAVLVGDASLVVSKTVFHENEGEIGTIAALFDSDLDLASTCFIGNKGTSDDFASTVYVDGSSDLVRSELNFGLGNMVNNELCTDGVNLQSQTCVPFSSRFCESAIYDSRDIFVDFTSCVNDFQTLAELIAEGSRRRIEICPLALFDLETPEGNEFPFVVHRSNITISCGKDGSRLNMCRFVGGDTQVSIIGNATGVVLEGLTFDDSTVSSAVIEGHSPLSVEFVDCVWREATGETVLSVTSLDPETTSPTAAPSVEGNTDDVFEEQETDFFRRLTERGFDVSLKRCSFESNDVSTSLVVSRGAALNVASCTFTENAAGDSIVFSETGSLDVAASCFVDGNAYDETQGIVTTSGASPFESQSNFVESNGDMNDSGCDGIFEASTSTCQKFNSTFCQAATPVDCISSWHTLSTSIDAARTLGQGVVFTLCDDTVFEVDGVEPIELDIDNMVLQCGSDGALRNRCTVTGGAVQLRATGDGVTIRGLNLLNSSIAALHAAGDDSTTVFIEDCVFAENSGRAAVISYNGNIRVDSRSQERRRAQQGLLSESEPAMTINIRNSTFVDNNVEFAPLSILGGTLDIESTSFSENLGVSTGIGGWYGSDLQIEPSSCFDDGEAPSIAVDTDSSFAGLDVIVTGNSTDCTGILSGEACVAIRSQECDREVVPLPSRGCYDNWIDLGRAIASSLSQGRDEVSLSVCNNTVLDVYEDFDEEVTPIIVDGSGQVEIKCGNEGSRDGNCVIKGGRSHFSIKGTGTTSFIGLTFEEASFASILAAGDAGSIATFKECTWRLCDGPTTMLINKQSDPNADFEVQDLNDLTASSSPAMTVLVDQSSFENNDVSFATIANIGGTVNLLETLMVNNRDSRFGVIAALEGASVGLSFTCFTGNSALERGIVFVEQNSTLAFNRNSFASDNTVSQGNCSSIFVETEGSCAQLGTCEGECQSYESRTCRVTSFTVDSTVSPTGSPTVNPTFAPPTPDPTLEPTNSSGGGSNAGVVASAVVVPIVLIAIGLGAFFYARGKTKVGSDGTKDAPGDDENPHTQDGSHSRSKTQEELDDSDFDEVDLLAQPPQDMPPLNPVAPELEPFPDEPVEMTAPLNGERRRSGPFGMFRALSTRSGNSKSSAASNEDTGFVRIPRTIGRKQTSKDILSLRELPTTF